MRNLISKLAVALMATTSVASATDVSITFEARGLGSQVEWSQISGGFILDVILEAGAPMSAAGIEVFGDSGFHHMGTVSTWPGSVDNYEQAQGWSMSASLAIEFDPGNLPLSGGGNELGTIATSSANGASSGLFAWLEFDQVPAEGDYVIEPGDGSYVGETDPGQGAMNIVSTTPLTISGGTTPGGGGGGLPPDDGDDTIPGDDDDTTPSDGDDTTPGDGDDTAPDGDGDTTPSDGDDVPPSGDIIIAPPVDDDQLGDSGDVVVAPLICGGGVVEAFMMSLVGLFATQWRRRR